MDTSDTTTPKTHAQEIAEKRAALRDAIALEKAAQIDLDLDAILAAEVKYGPEQVAVLDLGYAKGSAVKVAVRAPDDFEMGCYRQFLKASRRESKVGEADATGAAIDMGRKCVVYPAFGTDLYRATIAAHAGVEVQLGTTAIGLSAGILEATGKDL